ncbi:MAG: hypothetical protein Q9203_002452 [Teloschistes exilis]
MAAMSSSTRERPKKVVKTGTASKRKHRFESFNQRIAKLNIDPVHKTRQPEELHEDDPTASYFKTDLDRWKDLNLSENFTAFLHQVSPLCNTLPQVLHYQKDIAETLAEYIKRGDSWSLEPLLSLLSCFAHDLGSKFEPHVSDFVTLVTSLAVKSPEFEVIEWSFNCLAWLFKYLSRLLVQDLRPLLNIMSPLLGRQPQKMFILRFAAESMSFLVRKTALVYRKNQKPLQYVLDFFLEDLAAVEGQEQNVLLYQHGLQILLVDAIKGIDRGLHSSGPTLYGCLLESTLSGKGAIQGRLQLLEGVTVGLIHHTEASTTRSLLDLVVQKIQETVKDYRGFQASANNLAVCERLLCVVSTARKGSRIQDWVPVLDILLDLLEPRENHSTKPSEALYEAAVVIMQSAPLDVLTPKIRAAMDRFAYGHNEEQFLIFCNFFCQLNGERFESLIYPYFLRFLASKWQSQQRQFCLTLPQIMGEMRKAPALCPLPWQGEVMACFEQAMNSSNADLIAECYGHIEALSYMTVPVQITDELMQKLKSMIYTALQSPDQVDPKNAFSLGTGLKAYAEYQSQRPKDGSGIWKDASGAAETYRTSPRFLEGILISLKAESSPDEALLDSLVGHMIENLHSPCHELRDLSIQIIQTAHMKVGGSKAEILVTAQTIENTPLDLKSARIGSMHIRKLISQYKDGNLHPWLQKAIPHFGFGIQTFKLAPVWDDAIDMLKQVCEDQSGEAIVSDMVFRWLEMPESRAGDQNLAEKQPSGRSLGDFECSNLLSTDVAFRKLVAEMQSPEEQLARQLREAHALVDGDPVNAAAIALRVLLGIPKTAEKKSRRLVPLFLQWASREEDGDASLEQPSLPSNEDGGARNIRLSGPNRKSMLRLFALFNNPRTLYKSAQVLDGMRNLLANGDLEIQKCALNAVFTWKIEALQPYKANLLNILDDSRFRDEISTFLQTDEQSSIIQNEHRTQLMPVLLRLLYGKLISNKKSQGPRRRPVLEALARFRDTEIQEFLDIAFGTIVLSSANEPKGSGPSVSFAENLAPRKQVGLLNMVKDMLTTLGTRLTPFTQALTVAVTSCIIYASGALRSEKPNAEEQESSQDSLLKIIRQLGIQCLNLLCQHCAIPDIEPCLSSVFSQAISPRLKCLPVDTAQSISGLLQLFSTWASSHHSALFLAEYDTSLLQVISSCLQVQFAKEEVKMFVLDAILKRLVGLVSSDHAHKYDEHQLHVADSVLRPNVDAFLVHVAVLLRGSPSRELLASAIEFVTQLAPMIEGSSETQNLLEIASFLLTQPSSRINPRMKGDLLHILLHFVPQHDFRDTADLQDAIFSTVSSLFGFFKDRQNRTVLVEVFSALAKHDKEVQRAAELCRNLNSYAINKVDEPDFDSRLQAFDAINEREFGSLTGKEWRPILHNMLFYVRDTEELAIRANASLALRRFIDANPVDTPVNDTAKSDMIKSLLLPAVRRGASETSELVRAEYLAVMGHVVRTNAAWDEVGDMTVLLVADDDEASFFSNVLHIQQHRRLRALRRLAAEARQSRLHSNNVAHFFLPLIEHFIFDKADDESAHNLSAETVTTVGALALALEWPQFRAIFRRYLGCMESKPDLEKTIIRLLGVLTESVVSAVQVKKENASTIRTENVAGGVCLNSPALARTMPGSEKLAEDLTKHLLPALTKYLHEKDEATVSLRVPVAVSAVKLLKLLTPPLVEDRLPPILTDVCNILRSRAQESRDLTRKTLVEMAVVAGPAYFGFILKELRRALARGYQLHVLSYTVHSLLVGTASDYTLGDLDYCFPQIVAIIMDDIFGATGQEKDAEEYISKMKEVKSSKSYDSMEIVAKTATAESFVHLVRPLQGLLEERLDLKALRKIDELLRRTGLGLLHNASIESRQVLIFSHEIVREAYASDKQHGNRPSEPDFRNKHFLIDVKGAAKASGGTLSSSRFKLIRFAFDLLRSVLHRYDSLRTPANLAGFMPMLGDAMVQANEEIQMSAIRLLTTIIAVPLPEIDENASVYVAEAVKIIKASPSTNAELAQAALKLVSAILRERRDVNIREVDLAYLLKRTQPDLEELNRQGVAFNLLKAVMARKIVIVEVYEILDTVASMMVTNQTRGARDQARKVYIDFLLYYPQGKGRFSKQLKFLARNLDYKHQEGRQSVMETIHLLLSKLVDKLQQNAVETFFVPLLMVMVNDEVASCREMAAVLVKTAFEKADADRSETFLALIRTSLRRLDSPVLVRVALQAFGMYLDIHGTAGEKELPNLFKNLGTILKTNLNESRNAGWELVYYALLTFSKACQVFARPSLDANTAVIWQHVRQCLSYHHLWVKTSAAQLQGMFFADIARTNGGKEKLELPLRGSGGLPLDGVDMEHITKASLVVFKITGLTQELASQTVRNLVFLAKMMHSTSWTWGQSAADSQSLVEEEISDGENGWMDSGTKEEARSGLEFVIQRASSTLRHGPLTTREPSLVPIKAAMQMLWALCNNLPIEAVEPSVETILLPLQHLTDPTIAPPYSSDEGFVNGYKALVSYGSEIMDMLQKKLGTTGYIKHLAKVREGVKERREDRRAKRRIEAVAEPEKMGRLKKRKGEKKKEKRKEKSAGQRKVMLAGRGRGKIRPPRRSLHDFGEVDFEREWKSLSNSLLEIHTKNASQLSFEELYRNAYKLVLRKQGQSLYEKVKDFEEEWLANEVRPRIIDGLPSSLLAAYNGTQLTVNEKRLAGEKLLRALKAAWEDHNLCMNMTTDVLMYMERVYCSDNRKPSIFNASMGQFRDHVLRTPMPHRESLTIATLLYKVILDQIQMDRDGDIVNTALLRSCAYMLEGLYETEDEQELNKLYITSFEPIFLAASKEYYQLEGRNLVAKGDAGIFCKHARKAATDEQDRCRSTLSTLTAPKIKAVVEDELVKRNLPEMILHESTGVKFMLDNDRLSDLEMIYELSSWVDPKKEELKNAVQKRIVEQGEEINSAAKDLSNTPAAKPSKADADKDEEGGKSIPARPINQQTAAAIKWVDDVLQLKDKYDQVLVQAFQSDQGLQTGFTRSFSDFINGFERSSEYLSLFFDENMKKDIKGKTETEVDNLLDKGITLLRYISDKDMFERYYKKHLSKRLLMKKSVSMDAERQMISKMKLEVGNTFTQRIEAMFRDISVSEGLTTSYKKHIRELGDADSQRAELDVNVLTATMWPMEAMSSSHGEERKLICIFPPEVDRIKQSFEKFYLNKHSGRQLTWQGNMGTAELRAYFSEMKGKKQRELNVSTHMMVIVLLFNDLAPGKFLSYDEIQARTNIPDHDLKRNLQSLAVAPKTRILVKEPMSKDVRRDDKFYFNEKFTSPFQRIKIGVVASGNKVEDRDERQETEKRVDLERGQTIEAAIVRTMKQRKELKHQQLITEVIQQLSARFSPDVNLLKKKIESLIEREYLERVGDIDKPAYRYMA